MSHRFDLTFIVGSIRLPDFWTSEVYQVSERLSNSEHVTYFTPSRLLSWVGATKLTSVSENDQPTGNDMQTIEEIARNIQGQAALQARREARREAAKKAQGGEWFDRIDPETGEKVGEFFIME